MKKFLRVLACIGLIALLTIPALAVDRTPPAKQGDFYVLVNGEYVTFPDAVPQIRNDRSCLPFAAVLEQLGFAQENISWDGVARTVTASKGDDTLMLSIGKNNVVLNGETITTDVAPYIDPATSRTYVPFGLVADVMGYSVGWDAQQRAVIIDDVDAILAANTETYELMDQYMAYSSSFSEKNQKVTGSYSADVALDLSAAGAAPSFSYTMAGDYEEITSGETAFQFTTDAKLNLTTDDADMKAMLGELFPMDLDIQLCGDLQAGKFYFQSKALTEMVMSMGGAEAPVGLTGTENLWYLLDMDSLMGQSDADLGLSSDDLMQLIQISQDNGFEGILSYCLKEMKPSSVDLTATDLLTTLNQLCADSSFKKVGENYVNNAVIEDTPMTLTITTKNGKVNGCLVEMDIKVPEAGAVSVSASMVDKKMDLTMAIQADSSAMSLPAEGDLAASASFGFSMKLTMDAAYQDTTAVPVTAPPAGAMTLDLSQLLAQ